MPLKTISTGRSLMGGGTYADKVLSYSPIAYWPLWETAGAVAECLVNPLQNGTAVGVTWNDVIGSDGVNGAPFFDGANDYVNIFTAAFDAAFNGATGTAMMWIRVANVGVWTDATRRDSLMLFDDGSNYYRLTKALAANLWEGAGAAGGGAGTRSQGGLSAITWIPVAITWSDGNNDDQLRAFWNGVEIGVPSAALNNWAGGGLTATMTVIGATTTGPVSPWHGWLAHCAVWDRVLTPAEIAGLAMV